MRGIRSPHRYHRRELLRCNKGLCYVAVHHSQIRNNHMSEKRDAAYVDAGGLRVAIPLHHLIENDIVPGSGIRSDDFWSSLAEIVRDLAPKNRQLLAKRDAMQSKMDQWYVARRGQELDAETQKQFLLDIGYLVPEGPDFMIDVEHVDDEIAHMAGPQLVVPLDNARYALNAANARWGSLYDALYGTNVIDDTDGAEKQATYNPVRGRKVVAFAKDFLDQAAALANGRYSEAVEFKLTDLSGRKQLVIVLQDGTPTSLADSAKFTGYTEVDGELASVLLQNNNLHIEIQFDRHDVIGKDDPAGIKDIVIESAVTTIQDLEDAISAVDVEDKVRAYRNWLGIVKGDLKADFNKGDELVHRCLHPDRKFTDPNGSTKTLHGRSLLLIRNVGLHMYTDAVTSADGDEIPEGFLDAMVSVLTAVHDLKGNGKYRNSRAGSVYMVKPKLHGPEEVGATVELFSRVEDALGLARNTIKIGIMDEERRATVNLKECIRAAKERVIFINTGFLDRTGDEIHTAMEAGPMMPKPAIKNAPWILAYEDWNVDIGIECGLPGHAQIGKGMWAAPDEMKSMVETKIVHPRAGANTAWVPSPTAATLHGMHYHKEDVFARQHELATRARASLDDILTPPLLGERSLTDEEIQMELDNNTQSILGYVVRWINQGVGCSKVPDINDVSLMEDRATLRISSQHIANWLYHAVITKDQVVATMKKMALVVDRQNHGDPNYRNLTDHYDSPAFQGALDLVFKGREEANGYTEPVLHARRREVKAGS